MVQSLKFPKNGLVKISLQNNKINKPKEIFKKIIDKIIEEKGSKEAKTLIFVGERYFVLSR